VTPVDVYLIVVCGVFGLLIGSFLNAWAYRWSHEASIAHGRSACPACNTQIAWYDNVPLVSYAVLRGHCRACHAPISARYPIGEALTAALFALGAAATGVEWLLVPQLVFLAVLVLVSEIDLEVRLIPNLVVLPAAAFGLGAMILIDPSHWYEYVAASLGAAAFFLVVAVLYERIRGVSGMGMGDVKLALCMGAYLGASVIPALFIGFILGAVFGGVVMARRKGTMKSALPFGPFMAAGGVIGLFLGPIIIDAYLQLALHR
jgi:leader peptidase (prepilin peptidase) / N-methyltransferase